MLRKRREERAVNLSFGISIFEFQILLLTPRANVYIFRITLKLHDFVQTNAYIFFFSLDMYDKSVIENFYLYKQNF